MGLGYAGGGPDAQQIQSVAWPLLLLVLLVWLESQNRRGPGFFGGF